MSCQDGVRGAPAAVCGARSTRFPEAALSAGPAPGGGRTPAGRFLSWRRTQVQALRPLAAARGPWTRGGGWARPGSYNDRGAGRGSLSLEASGRGAWPAPPPDGAAPAAAGPCVPAARSRASVVGGFPPGGSSGASGDGAHRPPSWPGSCVTPASVAPCRPPVVPPVVPGPRPDFPLLARTPVVETRAALRQGGCIWLEEALKTLCSPGRSPGAGLGAGRGGGWAARRPCCGHQGGVRRRRLPGGWPQGCWNRPAIWVGGDAPHTPAARLRGRWAEGAPGWGCS